ncbi:hypothetical protein OH407_24385, partial [Salmonella enterica]|uniref:MurR/RpiR family transcriptional regulator n=1 Tax=Salmonella enterica TaxID=28901 RepID=UPI0022B6B912
NPFAKVVERDIAILRQTYNQLNMDDMWKAVDWLMEADAVLVVGYRASYAPAHWFSFILGEIRDNVNLCPSSGENLEKVLTLTEKSV